ncbi:hypothetical protein [Methylobacterium oryzihabitans]|uniref:Uncharacterized protein n=1 Tax=Methylobacterium oryzihabitans TaxID=2499852 RepID=A0A437NVI6_9HYPH|nr:hypothetical protein [Methylobacterium oryzihabitans]RVU14023.1 hypothetical protein EOE48_25160 [Methylobacterium oryzihabitans]
MMKSVMIAGLLTLGLAGSASAAGLRLDDGVYDPGRDAPQTVAAAWIGRYGQVCVPGPVWLPACHATDTPGVYIPGHWNPMHTQWIPGHYS